MEDSANTITAYIWLVLGIACLIGVIFHGAWWHLFTAAISFLLYFAMRPKKGSAKQ